VCATPLKLGFDETKALDQEMFAAIAQDLQARMKELHSLRQSIKYQTVAAQCNGALNCDAIWICGRSSYPVF
jgi:hypothetical protein